VKVLVTQVERINNTFTASKKESVNSCSTPEGQN